MAQKAADDYAAIARRMAEIEYERENQRVKDGFAEMNQRYIEEIGRVVAEANLPAVTNVSYEETNG